MGWQGRLGKARQARQAGKPGQAGRHGKQGRQGKQGNLQMAQFYLEHSAVSTESEDSKPEGGSKKVKPRQEVELSSVLQLH